MNVKTVSIAIVAILASASIYGVLGWFTVHSETLQNHEQEIIALRGELLARAAENETVQDGLLADMRALEHRLYTSEADTRSLVVDTDRSLREAVELTGQSLEVSVRDGVSAVQQEIADLSGVVEDTRHSLQQTQTDVDLLATAAEEAEAVTPPLEAVHAPPPELAVVVTEEKVVEASCPAKANNANKARRILTRVMERTHNQGSYLFSATFNINADGTTENVEVISDGPSDLRKAAARYASALEWTVDAAINNCKLNLKLDIE